MPGSRILANYFYCVRRAEHMPKKKLWEDPGHTPGTSQKSRLKIEDPRHWSGQKNQRLL